MEIIEAKNISATARFATAPQTWLDLGCGSGIFTLALAELLPFGSTIVCVDKEEQNVITRINKIIPRLNQIKAA